MLNDFTGAEKVYIACGYTDLRCGIDGLAGIVQQQFQLDPFTNTLFLFCGRRRDRIKALYWEGNGFVLLYKRLESGSFQWPRNEAESRELTPQQYRWLMEGLQIDQPKAHKAVSGLSIVTRLYITVCFFSMNIPCAVCSELSFFCYIVQVVTQLYDIGRVRIGVAVCVNEEFTRIFQICSLYDYRTVYSCCNTIVIAVIPNNVY